MGKLRVYCLKTLNKLSIYPLGNTPSAPSVIMQIERAEQWRDCESEGERDACFKAHGICWSVLLKLPYWNPILFSVLDSMHTAYLGLVHSHCHKIWWINLSVDGGEGSTILLIKDVPHPSDCVLSRWLAIIPDNPDALVLRNLLTGPDKCLKHVLWHICVDNNLWSAGGQKQLMENIVSWVSNNHMKGIHMLTSRI